MTARLSRRLAMFGAPVLAMILGTATLSSATTGVPAVAGHSTLSVATVKHVLASRCAPGTTPERDALSRDGASVLCRSVNAPESYLDLAARNSQFVAREAAPFALPAPGAFQSAVAQRQAIPGPGTVPGSSGRWSPAGTTPDCDARSSTNAPQQVCLLTDNTSTVTPANGDYTLTLLGHHQLSGRITSFASDPANPSRVFTAPGVGGVFETTDAGSHWHSIADALPTQAMGGVAYDSPLHRVFAGTGDNSFGGDAIQGLGIFYSDDDGGTWYQGSGIPALAETFKIQPSPADTTGKTVYAATSRGLFRSADGGTTWINANLPSSPTGYTVPDPTQNGSPQVPCDGNTTAPLCFFANIVTDVVVQKSGAVMAVLGWRAGPKGDKNPDGTPNMSCKKANVAVQCLQAPQNGLYQSTAASPNVFKFKSHAGGPTDFAADAIVGRTTLGIADGAGQNNNAVFALVQDANKFNRCVGDPLVQKVNVCPPSADPQALGESTVLDGAYATYDFGTTWKKIMDWSQLNHASGALAGVPGYAPGVQSWYNNWIKPDPTTKDASNNPTRVLFGLEEIWENNQGGVPPTTGTGGVLNTPYLLQPPNNGPTAPWVNIGRYWNDCGGQNATAGVPCDLSGFPSAPDTTYSPGGSTTHPDQHAFLFVPDGSGGVTFYAGNDGGAYKQHVARNVDFSQKNWGDGIDVGLYTLQPYDAAIARDGTIVAGLQDNGETKIAPNGKEQHTIYGGDGFMTMIDPGNSQNIIEEYTYGTVNLSINGGKDWYPGLQGGFCGPNESQFSTALEQDPTTPGHVMIGCTQLGDVTKAFDDPCTVPPAGTPGENPTTCNNQTSYGTTFDLGTVADPGHRPAQCGTSNTEDQCAPYNIPSALGVRGEHEYVGFCGYCDIVTGGLPFNSGIATNVGSKVAVPKIGSTDGWHFASALCPKTGPGACKTANGKLPKRMITSIQLDPGDSNTVYVTMGGYGRHWIPPGSLGDDVSNVGEGHLFVSHDHAEHFTNISGNLPDAPANWTLVHNGQLVVGTDTGAFIAPNTDGGTFGVLGVGLPNAPVFTMRLQPGNPDRMIVATYGRGVYQYCFAAACANAAATPAGPTTPSTITMLPPTATGGPLWPLLPTAVALAAAGALLARRRRRATR